MNKYEIITVIHSLLICYVLRFSNIVISPFDHALFYTYYNVQNNNFHVLNCLLRMQHGF